MQVRGKERVKERNGQAGARGSDPAPVQTRLGSERSWFLQQTPMGRGETTESTLSGEPWEGLRSRLRRGVLVLWVQGPLLGTGQDQALPSRVLTKLQQIRQRGGQAVVLSMTPG